MGLREQFADVVARRQLAKSTEKSYWSWSVRYMRWLKRQRGDWVHPKEAGGTRQRETMRSHRRGDHIRRPLAFSFCWRLARITPARNCDSPAA